MLPDLLESTRSRLLQELNRQIDSYTLPDATIPYDCECEYGPEMIRACQTLRDDMARTALTTVRDIEAHVQRIPESDPHGRDAWHTCEAHELQDTLAKCFWYEFKEESSFRPDRGLCLNCTRAGRFTVHAVNEQCPSHAGDGPHTEDGLALHIA